MANIPDRLVNKFNKFVRDALMWVGFIAALFAWGAYAAENNGRLFLAVIVALGAFGGAAKVKVYYRLKGGVIEYE